MDFVFPAHETWDFQAQQWDDLMERLFHHCQDEIARRNTELLSRQRQDFESWKPFVENSLAGKKPIESQWAVARCLLWCAEHAEDSKAVVLPDYVSNKDWARCCRLILRNMTEETKQFSVPVALVGPSPQSVFAVSLVIGVFDGGCGNVFQHPTDVLDPRIENDFIGSMKDAWHAAMKLAENHGYQPNDFDAIWQLQTSNLLKNIKISGRSASGVAAVAWYHLIKGTVIDDRLAILAEIDSTGQLKQVDDVTRKVEEFVKINHFDRIVVVGNNDADAKKGLANGTGMKPCVSVLGPPTLDELVKVRSQLHDAVLTYLSKIDETLERTEWMRGSEFIQESRIQIEPRVEFDKIGEDVHHRKQNSYDSTNASVWSQIRQGSNRRIGLLANAGVGKTFGTRFFAASCARESRELLQRHVKAPEDLEVPVWITAKSLVSKPEETMTVEQKLFVLQLGKLKEKELLYDWFSKIIKSEKATIVIDALDDLELADQSDFQSVMRELNSWKSFIITTCRKGMWRERKSWLQWDQITEVHLMPFDGSQQEKFVDKFFQNDEKASHQLRSILSSRDYVNIKNACELPLLLNIACLIYDGEKSANPFSESGLLMHMVRWLLSGTWRGEKPEWSGSSIDEERILLNLENFVWELFLSTKRLNRFALSDWENAVKAYGKRGKDLPLDQYRLLQEYEKVGIVVESGIDEHGDKCWRLIHDTFFEFFLARSLSRSEEYNDLKVLWKMPEATNILRLLEEMGTNDIGKVINSYSNLEGEETRQRALERLSQLHQNINPEMRKHLIEALKKMEDSRATELLFKLTEDSDESVKISAIEALGEKGDSSSVPYLLSLSQMKDPRIRQRVMETLGKIGDEHSIQKLLEYARSNDPESKQSAVRSLGYIGKSNAMNHLLKLKPALMLKEMSSMGLIDVFKTLSEVIDAKEKKLESCKQSAADSLRQILDSDLMSKLVELTEDKNHMISIRATATFDNMCTPKLADQVLQLSHMQKWGLGNSLIALLTKLIRDDIRRSKYSR
ncbi:MAG: hypothetical protein ILNGONEN_00198 [Syntrophorhabdaceae bacterium]|nr:hypothetical protein [Syntrophorhabdaceae bacterium]